MSDSASQFRHGIRHGHQQLAILNRSISYHFEFAQGFANGGFADPKAPGGLGDCIFELTALATQHPPILVGELGQCRIIGAPRPCLAVPLALDDQLEVAIRLRVQQERHHVEKFSIGRFFPQLGSKKSSDVVRSCQRFEELFHEREAGVLGDLAVYNMDWSTFAHRRPRLLSGTISAADLPMMMALARSCAARCKSSIKWLYRSVVCAVVWPNSDPMTGSDKPADASTDA